MFLQQTEEKKITSCWYTVIVHVNKKRWNSSDKLFIINYLPCFTQQPPLFSSSLVLLLLSAVQSQTVKLTPQKSSLLFALWLSAIQLLYSLAVFILVWWMWKDIDARIWRMRDKLVTAGSWMGPLILYFTQGFVKYVARHGWQLPIAYFWHLLSKIIKHILNFKLMSCSIDWGGLKCMHMLCYALHMLAELGPIIFNKLKK